MSDKCKRCKERRNKEKRNRAILFLEDLQDRASKNGIPKKGVVGLSSFTDFIRGLYPEYYSKVKEEWAKVSENNATEEDNEFISNMMIVRKTIREKHPEGNLFVKDFLPCPICKEGRVAFVISDHYNGHIHATCSTRGCVSWME